MIKFIIDYNNLNIFGFILIIQITANAPISASIIRTRMTHTARAVATNQPHGQTPKAAHTNMVYPHLPRGLTVASALAKNPTALRVSPHATVVSIPSTVVAPPGLLQGLSNTLTRGIVPIRTTTSPAVTVPMARGQTPSVNVPMSRGQTPAVTVPTSRGQTLAVTVPTSRGQTTAVTLPTSRGQTPSVTLAMNTLLPQNLQEVHR